MTRTLDSFSPDDQHGPLDFLTLFSFRAVGPPRADRNLLQLLVKGLQVGESLVRSRRGCLAHAGGSWWR
jgi:hypothetical protein